MKLRKSILSLAASALLATSATPVLAQAEIFGAVVGGIIGGAIANSNAPRTRTYSNSGYSAAREQNRQVQTALNYFGFPAGTPDGALGPNSRRAISSYQAYLGAPATGQLTEIERNVLTSAHTRAQTGAPDVMKTISRSSDGAKALLAEQYKTMTGTRVGSSGGYAGLPMEVSDAIDEIAESSDPSAEQLLQRSGFIQLGDMNGDGNTDYIIDTAFAGSSFWCNANQCKSLVFVSTPDGYRRNDLLIANPTTNDFNCIGGSCTVMAGAGQTTAPAATPGTGTTLASTGGAGLQVFGQASNADSLSNHCGRVTLLTNANGGFTTIDKIVDANLVLNEQFCLARTYSIEAGAQTALGMQGVSPDQIAQICGAYGTAMGEIVSGLSIKPRTEVVQQVSTFILDSGQDPAQLSTAAHICLGHGYQTDDMGMALGSGLLLVVLGEGAFGELIGHHLRQGIGATKRMDLAREWYDASLAAVDNGATRVFAPTMADRPALIRAALTSSAGAVAPGATEAGSTQVGLPIFR
ncbi:MAG: peptidoglycan-binding domain-containing protein [Pseudomonadota bacterium]|nr:peptidoglycan-binding domain-containing protein [Pseudomonadota bacterium]